MIPRAGYDQQLKHVQDELLLIGSMVEKTVQLSIESLSNRDLDLAAPLLSLEAVTISKGVGYNVNKLCVNEKPPLGYTPTLGQLACKIHELYICAFHQGVRED